MNNNNKIVLYTTLFIIAVVVLITISLIVIWSPDEKKVETVDNKDNVNSYIENTNFKEKTFNLYRSEVDRLLMPINVLELYENSNKEFLQKNNLTTENYKNYLEEKKLLGNNINFKSYSVIQNGNIYIYRIKYDVVSDTNYKDIIAKDNIVNIIEEKPFVYTISFEEQSLEILRHEVAKTQENIYFEIKNIENKSDSAKFEIKFTNNNEENINIDFDDINNVVLGLENGKEIKMAAAVISSDEEILTKGSSLKKEAFFSISLEEQGLIKYIKFRNVTIGDEEKIIKVEF